MCFNRGFLSASRSYDRHLVWKESLMKQRKAWSVIVTCVEEGGVRGGDGTDGRGERRV